jgi:hypothetical protein
MVGDKKRARHRRLLLALVCILWFSSPARALDANDFAGLVGFTVVASSQVKGDYYGAEAGKPIMLDNGMSFNFSVRFSTYSYRPLAVVFAKLQGETEKARNEQNTVLSASAYKVLVQDRIYDASRAR